jgi:hypothetical protein
MEKSISLFLLLFVGVSFFACSALDARADQSYVDDLIKEAEQQKLYNDRYWHILLHYRKTVFGVKSLIDDPRFFLSKKGAHNPKAELEATLRAFFAAPDDPANPPVCRFIARYAWLKEVLRFDEAKLPVSECTKFNKTIAVIKPKSASLVFPASYMNNPASMFGHTLISIETEQKSKLLAHAVNYSAFTTEKNGLVFALKGLSGFYKGYYSILPYYQKVQEYNDINQRDIWEYHLNFTEDEVKKMVMHIWELQGIYSYYYFFDENCSYNILFLLEAGRPSLHLTDQFYGWVIPLDTIRMLERQGGIAASDYRPSKATKINYLASLLNREQQLQALELSRGNIDPEAISNQKISEQEKIRIIDLAIEYLQYVYVKKEIAKDRYTAIFLKLLKARSSLGKARTAFDEPVPSYPDKGHNSNRLGLGFGIKKGDWFEEIRFRFAYHTLIDYAAGYDSGSHIQFLNTALRYYSAKDKWELKSLDVIDIISLSPRNLLFKPFSWKVKTGWRQTLLGDGDDHLVYQLNTGGGFAYNNKFLGLYYAMIEGDINLAGALKKNYALGVGASVGTKKNFTEWWTLLLGAKALYYGLGDEHKTYELLMKHNFAISSQKSFSFKVSRTKTFGIYETDAVFMWNLYF